MLVLLLSESVLLLLDLLVHSPEFPLHLLLRLYLLIQLVGQHFLLLLELRLQLSDLVSVSVLLLSQ